MRSYTPDIEFTNMIEHHAKIIYKVCSLYYSPETLIEDLYQEVVYNLWKAFPKFRKESAYSTWIYRIALNTCISGVRKELRRPKNVPLNAISPLFEEPAMMDDQIKELYALIGRLKTLEKAIIMLYLEEKPYTEIAQITGLSAGNVAVRMKRIKEKLKVMSNNQ